MQSLVICVLIIGALGQLAWSQEVNSRAANPDEPRISAGPDSNSGLGGQARNIYSQKLSGHRMMHFGKKQVQAGAPDLVTQNNQAIEVYPLAASGLPQAVQGKRPQPFPYGPLLAQTISDGSQAPKIRVLEQNQLKAILRRQRLMDIVSCVLDDIRHDDQKLGQTKQKRPSEPKQQVSPMRLMLQDNTDALGFDFGLRPPMTEEGDEILDLDLHRANKARLAQQVRSSNLVEAKSDEQVGEQQGQENGNINLESRSVPMQFGPEVPAATRSLISNLLYGSKQASQRNSQPPNYAKKYDPNRMKFMHFG